MASAFNKTLGLPPPFPIYPYKINSNFGLYIRHGDGKLCFFNFHSAYAGKHALNTIIDGNKIRWLNDDEFVIEETGVRIRGEYPGQLDTLVEYKFRGREEEFEMPEPYASWHRALAGYARAAMSIPEPQKAAPVTRAQKPKVERTQKPDGLVSIGDIADKLKKEARDCRAALRKAKIEKPAHGSWAWNAQEAERIMAKLEKILK